MHLGISAEVNLLLLEVEIIDKPMTYFIYILFYILFSLSLFRVAQKTKMHRPWLAWIPMIQMWVPVTIAGKSWKWFVLLFVPFANIVAIWVVWGKVAQQLERSVWIGRAMLLPFVNLFVLPILAFTIFPTKILTAVYMKCKTKLIRKNVVSL